MTFLSTLRSRKLMQVLITDNLSRLAWPIRTAGSGSLAFS